MSWRFTDLSLLSLLLTALLVGAPSVSLAQLDDPTAENNFTETNKFLFVLGTDFNELSLRNAASDPSITSELNVAVFARNDTLLDEINFSDYAVVFIESTDEALVNGWNASINESKLVGVRFIGYNLSANITFLDVDLSSANYTNIERYWVQGGEANMENMLRLTGQKFCGLWSDEMVDEPELLRPKVNITFIANLPTNVYYLNKVISERSIITDLFDVTVMDCMDGEKVAAKLANISDQDVIMLYMVGYIELSKFKDALLDSKANGTKIGLSSVSDVYGVGTIDFSRPPYNEIDSYIYKDGYANMENFLRFIGAELEDAYIEYSPAADPEIPDHGIYHPDAFPRIFKDITEYLDWYAANGFNESAPTIGIIATNNIGNYSATFPRYSNYA